jgi:hypothetical protein
MFPTDRVQKVIRDSWESSAIEDDRYMKTETTPTMHFFLFDSERNALKQFAADRGEDIHQAISAAVRSFLEDLRARDELLPRDMRRQARDLAPQFKCDSCGRVTWIVPPDLKRRLPSHKDVDSLVQYAVRRFLKEKGIRLIAHRSPLATARKQSPAYQVLLCGKELHALTVESERSYEKVQAIITEAIRVFLALNLAPSQWRGLGDLHAEVNGGAASRTWEVPADLTARIPNPESGRRFDYDFQCLVRAALRHRYGINDPKGWCA